MVVPFLFGKEMMEGVKMNLREIRFKKRLTQYDICKFSGVPQSKISLIERGYASPTRKEKLAIAKALEVNPEEINWEEEVANG